MTTTEIVLQHIRDHVQKELEESERGWCQGVNKWPNDYAEGLARSELDTLRRLSGWLKTVCSEDN